MKKRIPTIQEFMLDESSNKNTNFLAAWDGDYFEEGKVQFHTLGWFNEDNGYEKEHVTKIKKLKLGQTTEIDKGHIIVRVSK